MWNLNRLFSVRASLLTGGLALRTIFQTAADKAKNRIKQALGEIGCDVFIETDR